MSETPIVIVGGHVAQHQGKCAGPGVAAAVGPAHSQRFHTVGLEIQSARGFQPAAFDVEVCVVLTAGAGLQRVITRHA